MAANALGNLLTAVGPELIKRAATRWTAGELGAAAGTAGGPGLGTAFGFVIGVLVESVASYMFEMVTGKADLGEKGADATEEVGRLIQRQHALLTAQHRHSAAELNALVAAALAGADGAETQEHADAIARWFAEEMPVTQSPELGPPYPMAQELLRVWALEHAGDLDSAHGATDSTQWERVAADVFGPDGIANVPDAFAFQTRAEWGRAGLDHAQETAAIAAEVSGLGDAAAIEKRFDRRTVHFSRAADAKALHGYLVDHDNAVRSVDAAVDAGAARARRLRRLVRDRARQRPGLGLRQRVALALRAARAPAGAGAGRRRRHRAAGPARRRADRRRVRRLAHLGVMLPP